MTDLIEPILRGIAHPHTALTEEQLAQVRADLELAEPKKCAWQRWLKLRGLPEEHMTCTNPAAIERIMVCGATGYRCAEHVEQVAAEAACVCGWRGPKLDEHVAAVIWL